MSIVQLPVLALLLHVAAVAQEPREAEPSPLPAVEEPLPMNNRRLGRLLKKHFRGLTVEGDRGAWRVELPIEDEPKPPAEANGHPAPEPASGPGADGHVAPVVVVLTDERADRMRIMMPIRPLDTQQIEDLRLAIIALHANYDRALDARYAIHDGVLWSVFIHPLGSLTSADLTNALNQVQTLRDNTGSTYSSSELLFGPAQPGPGDEPDQPTEDDPFAA